MSKVQTAHPSNEKLAAFVAGRLEEAERQSIESHVADCEVCGQVLQNLPDDSLASLLETPGAPGGVPKAEATCPTTVPPAGEYRPTVQETEGASRVAVPTGTAVPPELAEHARYHILGLLGAGGMGAVYKAEHRLMQRPVALKIISRELFDNPEAAERFRREARAAARLAHPNIVTAHDAEQAGDVHFLVMEFVEGTNLAQLVEQPGSLPVPQVCDYIRQAALGLQHAHERGMVHRDIKPHNLMRTPEGQIKILDFGLARFVAESAPTAALTKPGSVMGTPDYMAPEQALATHTADVRADIYALGCTFYHLLTGRPPFPGGSLTEKLLKHQQDQPQPVVDLRPDVPRGLAAVLRKMMAKRPEERYQTPAAVAEALTPFALAPFGKGDTPPASSPVPLPAPESVKRRVLGRLPRWWWMPATGAAAVLLVVATILAVRTKPEDRKAADPNPAVGPGKITDPKNREEDPKPGPGQNVPPVTDIPAAVKVMVEKLEDADAQVRREAAWTLRKLRDKSAVPALMKRIADDAWGRTRGPFAQLASDDVYEDVATGRNQGSKYAALEALRELAPERVTEALQQALKSRQPAVTAWAIRNLADQKANDQMVKAVADQLVNRDAQVRRGAARALRKLGDKAAVPALVQRIADDVWGQTRGPFAQLASDDVYEDVATGRNQGSKYAALEALREVAPEKVTEALALASRSKEPQVRAWAVRQIAAPPEKK
jgi:HEAT repeat protein